jgi:hypothetical protein
VGGPVSGHDFARRGAGIQPPIKSQPKYDSVNGGMESNNASMRGQNYSVSCIYLGTIETLAGE